MIHTKLTDTKVVTKEGECRIYISLDLNINVDANGAVKVSAQPKIEQKGEEDKVIWAIPDFGGSKKVKFGKTDDEPKEE